MPLDEQRVGLEVNAVADAGVALWRINRHVADTHLRSHLLVHAAAVGDERGLVLVAGRSHAGKSTLASTLVQRGFAYVTDELVMVDPQTHELVAYRKPLSIRQPAWHTLPAAIDRSQAAHRTLLVDPGDLGDVHDGTSDAQVRAVVLAQWDEDDGALDLRPLSAGEALHGAASNLANLRDLGGQGLVDLARWIDGAPGYALRFNDSAVATDSLVGALDDAG